MLAVRLALDWTWWIEICLSTHLQAVLSHPFEIYSSTATFHTLFWALFGMSSNNVTMVEEELASVYPGHEHLRVNNAAFMISSLGSVLYGVYNACMIIILLNMLIAMMSKSFDEIQVFEHFGLVYT